MSKEQLQRAQTAKSLRSRSYADSSVDWVAASGLAQINKPHIGALVQRAAFDERELKTLAEQTHKMVRSLTLKNKWRLRGNGDMQRFAAGVINYWLDPKCTTCHGRGVEVVAQVTGTACPACQGTGQRATPDSRALGLERAVSDEHLKSYLREILNRLDSRHAEHIRRTRERLG